MIQSDLAAGILAAKWFMSPNVRNDEVALSDRDGSCLSTPAQVHMRYSHSFTACTMIVSYHARKWNSHCLVHEEYSILAGMFCNDTSTNARTMRNECGYDRYSMTAYKTVCDDKTKRR